MHQHWRVARTCWKPPVGAQSFVGPTCPDAELEHGVSRAGRLPQVSRDAGSFFGGSGGQINAGGKNGNGDRQTNELRFHVSSSCREHRPNLPAWPRQFILTAWRNLFSHPFQSQDSNRPCNVRDWLHRKEPTSRRWAAPASLFGKPAGRGWV